MTDAEAINKQFDIWHRDQKKTIDKLHRRICVTEEKLDVLEHMTVVCVEDNDVIVIRFEREMSSDQRERVRLMVREIFPDNKCMVLCGGAEMEVLRPNGISDYSIRGGGE